MLSGIGRLAQLVERLPYKQDVTGSSPVLPIFVRSQIKCRDSQIKDFFLAV